MNLAGFLFFEKIVIEILQSLFLGEKQKLVRKNINDECNFLELKKTL